MASPDLEGTEVLEKLASISKIDAFIEAVDSDHLAKAAALMRQAGVDSKTISTILAQIAAGE